MSDARLASPGNSEASAVGSRPVTKIRYELLAPSALDDAYPLYDEMRATAPVYRDRRFFGWILTRYDDVAAVLRDNRVSPGGPPRMR
jgi:cytochrome P450